MRRTLKFLVPFILAICLFSQASACSLFFFGGDYTDDGANLFVRIEDGDLNDENKLLIKSFYIVKKGTRLSSFILLISQPLSLLY